MNQYKDEFSTFESDYLIELRAQGESLVEEGHQAIESILTERGISLPPRPTKPIEVASLSKKRQRITGPLPRILGMFVPVVVGKLIGQTSAGVVISVVAVIVFGIVYLFNLFRRLTLSETERQDEDLAVQTSKAGMTELMTCAAEGNLSRIKEIVAYRPNVNEESYSGATALMYAALNNHLPVVEYLLSLGADPLIKTVNGQTASEIARKNGYIDLAERIEMNM